MFGAYHLEPTKIGMYSAVIHLDTGLSSSALQESMSSHWKYKYKIISL